MDNLFDQDDFDIKEFGPKVSDPVATKMEKIIGVSLTKEQIQQLKTTVKVPENCKYFQTPKLNPEIWAALPNKTRLLDVKQQSVQQNFTFGISAFAQIADTISKVQNRLPAELKESGKEIAKLCVGGANFMAMGLRDSSHRRRQIIRPNLSSQYGGICSFTTEHSTLLFGDNLSDKLKQSRTVSNIMKFPASRSYSGASSSYASLNFRGQTRRFRGQSRGRPYGYQRYNQRRPYSQQYNQNFKPDQSRQYQ